MHHVFRLAGVALAAAPIIVLYAGCGGGSGLPPGDGGDGSDGTGVPPTAATGSITGTIVDAGNTSAPVADAYVYVPPKGPVARAAARQTLLGDDRSAADGSFAVSNIPAGTHVVVVEPPAASGYAGIRISIEITEQASIEIQITLVRLEDRIADVIVEPQNTEVAPGGTVQYSATVLDATGQVQDLAPTWVATNDVGTFDENALFTAGADQKRGTIAAVVGAYSGSTPVTVRSPGNELPIVTLDALPLVGTAPLAMLASATASDADGSIASVEVDWDDGTPPFTSASLAGTLTHVFENPGSYSVKARAWDDQGAEGLATVLVTAQAANNQQPTCGLTASPAGGEAPLDVAFSGTGNDADGTITQWLLEFGDLLQWTSTTVPDDLGHTYTGVGTYEARLTVTDNAGGTGTATATITVSSPTNQPPTAVLSATPSTGAAPLAVMFTGLGADRDGTVDLYRLDFHSDGTVDWEEAYQPAGVTYVYASAGTYSPTLTVVDDQGAPGTTSQTVTVSGGPILAVSPATLVLGLGVDKGSFAIANAGGSPLTWTATPSAPWLGVSPSSGTDGASVTIGVDRAMLGAATHLAVVSIASDGGSGQVDVIVDNGASAGISANPAVLDFPIGVSTATLSIENSGDVPLNWTATASQPWLTVLPSSGANATVVTVIVDRTDLLDGTHHGTISITSDGGNVDVPVSLEVPPGDTTVIVR